MDGKLTSDDIIVTPEYVQLQDLSQHGVTASGGHVQSHPYNVVDILERARSNIDEDSRRHLLEEVLGLLAQNATSFGQENSPVNQTNTFNQTTHSAPQPSGSNEQGSNIQIPNIAVPVTDGYKLDLTKFPGQKNVKIKFDATEQNVRIKNVMKDVAKYGDQYANNTTATHGVLTVSILLQNISQLKLLVNTGPDGIEDFWFLVVLIPLSLLLQLIGGAMILYLGRMKTETNNHIKSTYCVGRWVFYVSAAASLINTIIASLHFTQ